MEGEGVDGEGGWEGGGHGDAEVFCPAEAFEVDPFVFVCFFGRGWLGLLCEGSFSFSPKRCFCFVKVERNLRAGLGRERGDLIDIMVGRKRTFDLYWRRVPASFHQSAEEDGDVGDFAILKRG